MVAAVNIADGVLLYLILDPCRHECPCLDDNTSCVFLDEMKRAVGVCRRHLNFCLIEVGQTRRRGLFEAGTVLCQTPSCTHPDDKQEASQVGRNSCGMKTNS